MKTSSNTNPLRSTLADDSDKHSRSFGNSVCVREDQEEIYEAFDKSFANFNLPDISLAKCLSAVEEKSTPKSLWNAYDSYAGSSKWCKLDQMRLISLDFMFRRYLSYNKNHLTFRVSTPDGYNKWLPPYDLETVAFESQAFYADKSYEPSRSTRFARLQADLASLSDDSKYNVLWLHMTDLRCLEEIGKTFQLHKYAQRFFLDLRCHSSITSLEGGFFVSVMTVRIICSQAHLYKIYYFASDKLVLTFERELLCDGRSSASNEVQGKTSVPSRPDVTSSFSVLSSHEMLNEKDAMLAQAIREEIKTSDTKYLDALNVFPLSHGVVSLVMSKCGDEVYASVCSGGSMFLLYEIMMQSLVASESVLEFMARSLEYFKSQIFKKLSIEAQKNFFRENATLKSSVSVLTVMVDDVLISLHAMMNKNTKEFDNSYLNNTLMNSWEATLCVAELEDSFFFRKICLEAQISECEVLAKSLEHQVTLTSERESMNLNLVATIFLPLTFFAGVFGMNFQTDGGYTMDVLNKSKGPMYFWVICLFCILVNVIIFLRSGLIDLSFISTKFLHSPPPEDVAFDRSVMKMKQNIRSSIVDDSSLRIRRSNMNVEST